MEDEGHTVVSSGQDLVAADPGEREEREDVSLELHHHHAAGGVRHRDAGVVPNPGQPAIRVNGSTPNFHYK